jgi:hypothetical protein
MCPVPTPWLRLSVQPFILEPTPLNQRPNNRRTRTTWLSIRHGAMLPCPCPGVGWSMAIISRSPGHKAQDTSFGAGKEKGGTLLPVPQVTRSEPPARVLLLRNNSLGHAERLNVLARLRSSPYNRGGPQLLGVSAMSFTGSVSHWVNQFQAGEHRGCDRIHSLWSPAIRSQHEDDVL